MNTHELLAIFLWLCVVGLILYGIQSIPGIPSIIKVIVTVLVGIFLIYHLAAVLHVGII